MEFDQLWNCYLVRRDGTRQPWEQINTSAGQRQVRILAFTEALRGLARTAPPLVIDTPLGRLDKEVKEGVLERLYLTGHQSIILSTNSEIEPNSTLFERISPKLARVYTLNAVGDPESQSYEVKVTADYFKHVL
jgi:DNA sulfur modification protein DndD